MLPWVSQTCLLSVQEVQTKEIKNGRLAMVAFVGFIIQAQATGQVPATPLHFYLSPVHFYLQSMSNTTAGHF